MGFTKWIIAPFKAIAKANAELPAEQEADVTEFWKAHLAARRRVEEIATEKRVFVREFATCLLAAEVAPRFLELGMVNKESAEKMRELMGTLRDPDYHDGELAVEIANAAWEGYKTGVFGG